MNSSGSTVLLGACRALIGPRASHVTLVSCLVNIRTAGEVELRNSGRESVCCLTIRNCRDAYRLSSLNGIADLRNDISGIEHRRCASERVIQPFAVNSKHSF